MIVHLGMHKRVPCGMKITNTGTIMRLCAHSCACRRNFVTHNFPSILVLIFCNNKDIINFKCGGSIMHLMHFMRFYMFLFYAYRLLGIIMHNIWEFVTHSYNEWDSLCEAFFKKCNNLLVMLYFEFVKLEE